MARSSGARFYFFSSCVAGCLGAWGCASPAKRNAPEAPLEHARWVAEEIEAVEGGKEPSIPADRMRSELERAEKDVAADLSIRPDDEPAIVLAARLERLHLTSEAIVVASGSPDPRERVAPIVSKLDRALALRPEDATAHYWRARVLGTLHPVERDGRLRKQAADLEGAIAGARKAVELEPGSVPYREALATYLVGAQRESEALEALKQLEAAGNPMYTLLSDWKVIQVPDGAIFSQEDSDMRAEQQIERQRFHDFPGLRVRFWLVNKPAREIEEHFARSWPGFQLIEQSREQMEGGVVHFQVQFLREKGGRWTQAASRADLPTTTPSEGLWVSVIELDHPKGKMREQTPAGRPVPESMADVFSYLDVVDYRAVR